MPNPLLQPRPSGDTLDLHTPFNALDLEDYLRVHATMLPTFNIQIQGTHQETRTETDLSAGRHDAKTRTWVETVVDFDFKIDASDYITSRGFLYSAGAWLPEYRGHASRTIGRRYYDEHAQDRADMVLLNWGRGRQVAQHVRQRELEGLPMFVAPEYLHDLSSEDYTSTPMLYHKRFVDFLDIHTKEFSDDTYGNLDSAKNDAAIRNTLWSFCQGLSFYKELTVEKEVYGWNKAQIEVALKQIVSSTGYQGRTRIKFNVTNPQKIMLRPNNAFAKIFSLPTVVKVLLTIVLVYPLALLLAYAVGRRYTDLKIAYPLLRWRRVTELEKGAHTKTVTCPQALESDTETVTLQLEGTLETEFLSTVRSKVLEGVGVSDSLAYIDVQTRISAQLF